MLERSSASLRSPFTDSTGPSLDGVSFGKAMRMAPAPLTDEGGHRGATETGDVVDDSSARIERRARRPRVGRVGRDRYGHLGRQHFDRPSQAAAFVLAAYRGGAIRGRRSSADVDQRYTRVDHGH